MEINLTILSELLYQKIDELLDIDFFNGKKIVLFGFNSTSHCIKKYLENRRYSIFGYIDNNKNRVNNRKDIYLPEELLKGFQENIVILIASKYYNEMESQLKRMGYQTGRHIIKMIDYYGIDSLDQDMQGQEELSKKEIRALQINILKYVKKVCQENGLRYYLAAGTMLGAVRHQGFIPWDDDIDLLMPLQDCKTLMAIVEKDNKYFPFDINHQPNQCYKFYYRIVDGESCAKIWDYPFLTTAGVSIDIFPLVGLPYNYDERFVYINKIAELKTDYLTTYMAWNKNSVKMKELRKSINEKIQYMIQKYDYDRSLYVGNPVSKYREKESMPKEIFDITVEVNFEGEKYYIPKQYDVYLKKLYGNYLEFPPLKERETTHNYRVYKR